MHKPMRPIGWVLLATIVTAVPLAGGAPGLWSAPVVVQAATDSSPLMAAAEPAAVAPTPEKLAWLHQSLDRYLQNDDPTFSWTLSDKMMLPSVGTIYRLSLTSQTWHDIVWQHRLLVFVPQSGVNGNTGLLYITGSEGENQSVELMGLIANQIHAPVAVLYDVPNQPLLGGLTEDALIAETFVRFLQSGDPTWAALLPMTKAAVRAMDAVQAFASQQLQLNLTSFVVTGASKRGWTTWLTGAADRRVKGIAPMVYNNLNLPAQMQLQKEEFGDYSLSIGDYTAHGLTDLANSAAGEALAQVVDPYSFVDRLTMPKLIIEGTNDPYWPVDALNIYRPNLKGETYQLFIPNAGHGLAEFDTIASTLSAFYLHVVGRLALPQVEATFSPAADEEGVDRLQIQVKPADKVQEVQIWAAVSSTKDFRSASWMQVRSLQTPPFEGSIRHIGDMHGAILAQIILDLDGHKVTLSTPVFMQ
ncbi:MAG: hypothetical protein IMX01_08060 [Limnochordaceae bacterium]|nr:hypothetical protein [Limnochordaceae bacterium]